MANTVQTINPATEETLQTYTLLSTEEANKAIDASHDAYNQWRKTSLEERSKLLHSLADTIEAVRMIWLN